MPKLTPIEPLCFKVAPHIVEDLGLNLYTTLPRVLVEFVANGYDADSESVNILLDKKAIEKARRELKAEYELEKVQNEGKQKQLIPLESRTLPDQFKIVVEDAGHGMSRDDLNNKFLFAGRRRRREEPEEQGRTAGKKRPLMGRKGLGKLAGFGVAKIVTVETRKFGERHATRVVLNFDELVQNRQTNEIKIDNEERLANGGGFAASGTRIILSRLLYDPLKSRPETIEEEIADHFALIDSSDFSIKLNNKAIKVPKPDFAFAWPNPDELDKDAFAEKELLTESGTIKFLYRMRFTGENEALPASRRGVRVYSNKRLAAAPSLLSADTNMHGFRMTDYLDGVVHADFIEDKESDYIATDRQSLRWESPLLAEMYEFLSEEIKESCKQYQKLRDDVAPSIVKSDPFTKDQVAKCQFGKKDERMAYRFAVILKNACKKGVSDDVYKTKLPVLLNGLGHGTILTAISELAAEENPDLQLVAVQVANLTKDELDRFIGTVKARLTAISALKKIVNEVNFKSSDNEKTIQQLFEGSPWLIDPTYTQFLTADSDINTLFNRLARELGVGSHAPSNAEKNDDRPDLVFLLGNVSLRRLVIIELKSANLPLEDKHRTQLQYYMETAENWLASNGHTGMQVHGHLIGTMPAANAKGRGAVALKRAIRKAGTESDWSVRDYIKVLEDTREAHRELLASQGVEDE